MKNIVLSGLIFLCVSCHSDRESTMLMDSDTINSDRDSLTDLSFTVDTMNTDTVVIDTKLDFFVKAGMLKKKYLRQFDESGLPASLLPDRFASDSSFRFRLKRKETVKYGESLIHPEISFYAYRYKDSASYNNAVFNWMNCFGSDCTPIIEDMDMKAIKTTPSMSIFAFPYLLHMSWACEHEGEHWKELLREAQLLFAVKGAKKLTVKCGGPLKWN